MKKKIKFTAKAAKFGSQFDGDKRAFIVPRGKISDVLSLIGSDKAMVTVEKI